MSIKRAEPPESSPDTTGGLPATRRAPALPPPVNILAPGRQRAAPPAQPAPPPRAISPPSGLIGAQN